MPLLVIFLAFLGYPALSGFVHPIEDVKVRADKTRSMISYTAKHELHTWEGVNRSVDCLILYDAAADAVKRVVVSAQVSSFDSQNSSRDSHALEVLESIKYPRIQFASTSVTTQDSVLTVNGNLTFHGVVKPISFLATRRMEGRILHVKGGFPVSLTAYNVERPSFMLIKTEDEIVINFDLYFPRP